MSLGKNNMEEELSKIRKYLYDRNYRYNTVKLYTSKLTALFYFYPTIPPQEISEKQIVDYAAMKVKRRKSSFSTISQIKGACKFYYNDILRKEYDLNNIKLPIRKFVTPEFLSQEEAFKLIDSANNSKHKAILSLLYSCGLEVEELLNIKITDVQSKQQKLIVRNQENDKKREAFLSKEVIDILKKYWLDQSPKPKHFFFEGQKGGKYSSSSVRGVFKQSISKVGLDSSLTPMNLRRTYVKHMFNLGIPLITILDELDIRSWDSQRRYTKYIYGKKKIDFSPFDKIVIENEFDQNELSKIEKLIMGLDSPKERDYLIEALSCMQVGALRASVLLIWNACLYNIRQKCIDLNEFKKLNEEAKKQYNKAKQIKKIEDFEHLTDKTTIIVSCNIGVFTKFQKDILIDSCLSLRNKCGHPSDYSPEEFAVKAFIENIIKIVFEK